MVSKVENRSIRPLIGLFLSALIAFCAIAAFSNTAMAEASNLHIAAPEKTGNAQNPPLTLAAKSKAKPSGLVEKKSGLYFYQNGKKVKSAWKTVKGKKYYFNKKGVALTGKKRISGIYYLFDGAGVLRTQKKAKLLTIGKSTYYVTKKGQLLTGWQLKGSALYHFAEDGKMDKGKTVDKVRLGANGKASNSKASKSKIAALKILKKISSPTDSKAKRLNAAWNFLTSRKNFIYRSIYPNQSVANWQHSLATSMLEGRMGNCYGFACAFAAFAEVIGYEPQLVLGRVHGSRDGAADGYTRHAWVKINNRHYDPEIHFIGVCKIYASPIYLMSCKNVKIKKF